MTSTAAAAKETYQGLIDAGARAYQRQRHLRHAIECWDYNLRDPEIIDAGAERITRENIKALERKLKRMRFLCNTGNWAYDPCLHRHVESCLQGEIAILVRQEEKRKAVA